MKISSALFYVILFGMLGIISCDDDDDEEDFVGNWVERSDFEGFRRSSAVSFTAGEFAYVGTGFNGDEDEYYRDFWRYSANQNFWQQVAEFPGVARSAAVAFSINGIGYVGTGYDGDVELNDFYSYDPSTDSWTRIADFIGSARRNAVAFSIGGKGYVGTGDDGNTLKDFYEYDPSSNSWSQIPSIGGSKRVNTAAFTIGDFVYVGTGSDNGRLETDFWRFDQTLLPDFPWVELTDLDDDDDYEVVRENAVAFSVNGLGYFATGTRGSDTNAVWEYDTATDIWIEKTGIEGPSRRDAVSFVLNGRAFIATGRIGSSYFDDIWEFEPFEEEDEDD